jgi:hypothetical protein
MTKRNVSALPTVDVFATTDLYLAAYLMARGLPLERVGPDVVSGKPGRLLFCFAGPQAREMADSWVTSQVPTLAFISAIRTIKQLAGARRGAAT